MRQLIAKIILALAGISILVATLINAGSSVQSKTSIISTSFVGYDFARAVTGDKDQVSMLLKPGAEVHNYEPTPQDIINIKNAKLFIYIGGESEEWVEKLLADNNISTERRVRLMDYVEPKTEVAKEGMESDKEGGEEEYDEHIWTSIPNAMHLVNAIRDKLTALNAGTRDKYAKNAEEYTNRLKTIDDELRATIAKASNHTLIFGDRFPFRYFTDEYGLDYYAAFPGCSDQTEASASTISFLINKARELGAKAIFKTEMTSGSLAETIANEAGAKVYTLHAAHNISKEELTSGLSYADIMERNVKTLREALN